MANSGGEALRAFVPILHLLDDDQSAGDEIISNTGCVIEDFQRFILHFQLLKISGAGGRAPPPAGSPPAPAPTIF